MIILEGVIDISKYEHNIPKVKITRYKLNGYNSVKVNEKKQVAE